MLFTLLSGGECELPEGFVPGKYWHPSCWWEGNAKAGFGTGVCKFGRSWYSKIKCAIFEDFESVTYSVLTWKTFLFIGLCEGVSSQAGRIVCTRLPENYIAVRWQLTGSQTIVLWTFCWENTMTLTVLQLYTFINGKRMNKLNLNHPFTHLVGGCCHVRGFQHLWEQLRVKCLARGHSDRLGRRDLYLAFTKIKIKTHFYQLQWILPSNDIVSVLTVRLTLSLSTGYCFCQVNGYQWPMVGGNTSHR